jgi:hypothetical protein
MFPAEKLVDLGPVVRRLYLRVRVCVFTLVCVRVYVLARRACAFHNAHVCVCTYACTTHMMRTYVYTHAYMTQYPRRSARAFVTQTAHVFFNMDRHRDAPRQAYLYAL